MRISKEKGWYSVTISGSEDIHFHQNDIIKLEEAVKIIKSLCNTWGFDDYTLNVPMEVK